MCRGSLYKTENHRYRVPISDRRCGRLWPPSRAAWPVHVSALSSTLGIARLILLASERKPSNFVELPMAADGREKLVDWSDGGSLGQYGDRANGCPLMKDDLKSQPLMLVNATRCLPVGGDRPRAVSSLLS